MIAHLHVSDRKKIAEVDLSFSPWSLLTLVSNADARAQSKNFWSSRRISHDKAVKRRILASWTHYILIAHTLLQQKKIKHRMSAIPIAVVTGAGGFVATELINQLLSKGYTVRGTVRSVSDASKVQHLTKLGDALPGKLELREADLLQVCICVARM